MLNTLIGEPITASKINVSNSVASLDKSDNSVIRQVYAMTKVDVVQVLAQTTNCRDSAICDVSAFGEYEISQFRSSGDYPTNGVVTYILTTCKV